MDKQLQPASPEGTARCQLRATPWVLFYVLTTLLTLSTTAIAGLPTEKTIDSTIERARKAWKVPGTSVAIVHQDKVIYLKGHGIKDVDSREPMTPDTLFPMASCSKAFTTAGLAMLVDEGKLLWNDHPRKYVNYFKLADPLADKQVMLRDLLSHRTGLGSHDYLWFHSPWSAKEVIERVGRLPLLAPIRSRFQYQSTMFTVAGFALASAADQPWEIFIQKRIFDPLKMKDSRWSTRELNKVKDRATGHFLNERGQPIPQKEWYRLDSPDPAGSISSTARDLCQWLKFQVNQGSIDGKRLVSTKALNETHTPQMLIPMTDDNKRLHPETNIMTYGMAWVVQDYRGEKLIAHAGAIDGFKAHITLIPEKQIAMAILTNLDHTRMNLALSYTLTDLLLGLKKERDWNRYLQDVVKQQRIKEAKVLQKRIAERKFDTKPSLPLSAFTGTYTHPAYGECRVSLQRGRLIWRWSNFAEPITHFHDDIFALNNRVLGRMELSFQIEARRVEGCEMSRPLAITFKKRK